MRKNKYSTYIKVPYLWRSNETKITIVIKRIIKYDEWMTVLISPIDNVGEKKILQGRYTIEVNPKKKGQNLEVIEKIKKEE